MRTTSALAALALVLSISSVAAAQPGATPPPVYAPPPPVYAPPPQPIALTMEEQRLLARGEISAGAHAGGAVVSFFLGFGTGQAVQGRWSDTGWIFTVGEAASIAAILVGIGDAVDDCYDTYCDDENDGLIAVGIIGLVGFRIWELVDAFAGPSSHNRKVRDLHRRLGYPQPYYSSVTPFVAPARGGNGGGVAGITVRF